MYEGPDDQLKDLLSEICGQYVSLYSLIEKSLIF